LFEKEEGVYFPLFKKITGELQGIDNQKTILLVEDIRNNDHGSTNSMKEASSSVKIRVRKSGEEDFPIKEKISTVVIR